MCICEMLHLRFWHPDNVHIWIKTPREYIQSVFTVAFMGKCLWQSRTQKYEEWLRDCSIHNSRDWYSKYRNALSFAVIYFRALAYLPSPNAADDKLILQKPLRWMRNMRLFLCLIVSHLRMADINVSPEPLQRNECKRKVWKTVPPKEAMYCGNMFLEVNTWRCK